jgi:hypothetical protein
MPLELDKYVFAMLETQTQLMDFLGEYSWEFRMGEGTIVFSFDDSQRRPIKCPIQLLGTVSYHSQTWLWAWANAQSNIPGSLLHGVERVKKTRGIRREALILPGRTSSSRA